MKYRIEIPKPSANRLESKRTFIIKSHDGWAGDKIIQESDIPAGVLEFDFEFGLIEQKDSSVLDGSYHEFTVRFQNSTGSRIEEISVNPVPLDFKTQFEELREQVINATYWLNIDGSPCDGFRFREEMLKLRAMVGCRWEG